MTQLFANDANALLTAPVAPGDLTFTIEASKADKFPVANTGTDPVGTVGKDWFKAALENSAGEIEYVHVRTRTLASGICSNVIRAREGSVALSFAAGSVCELRVVADDVQDALNAPVAIVPFLVPVGGIIMYSGDLLDLSANWKLCDGTNGTPNLRDKFIVGAGTTYAQGNTGGTKDAVVVSHSHTASTGGESADHTHSGTTSTNGQHQHFVTEGAGSADGGNLSGAAGGSKVIPWSEIFGTPNLITAASGNHSHTFTTGGRSAAHTHAVTVDAAGVSGTDKNLPPYYALAYIMRVA